MSCADSTSTSDVPGYEGVYQVTTAGEVFRVRGGRGCRPGRKQPTLDKSTGYLVVGLWSNNKGHREYVHRIVAKAFVPGDTSLSVNHKDGNKLNNTPDNLEWVSLADNTRHQHATGLANTSTQYQKGWNN
jgi:hypothetical protein